MGGERRALFSADGYECFDALGVERRGELGTEGFEITTRLGRAIFLFFLLFSYLFVRRYILYAHMRA